MSLTAIASHGGSDSERRQTEPDVVYCHCRAWSKCPTAATAVYLYHLVGMFNMPDARRVHPSEVASLVLCVNTRHNQINSEPAKSLHETIHIIEAMGSFDLILASS